MIFRTGFTQILSKCFWKNKLNVHKCSKVLETIKEEHMYKLHGWCFGEDQCRIIISTNNPKKIINLSKNENIEVLNLGKMIAPDL